MRNRNIGLVIGFAIISSSMVLTSCSLRSADESSSESTLDTEKVIESPENSDDVTEVIETQTSESKTKKITDINSSIWDIYWETNIVFEEGELEMFVKSDIGLPTVIKDATITWKSDNEDVIENDGTVHRQENYSPTVNMTATITNDEGSVEKTFELRVIRTELDDMKPEDVWVLDEVDQLYFFNDIIEDTYIYVNGEGYVTRVIGSIYEFKAECPDEVMLALYGIHNLIGCESVYDELVFDYALKDDYGYTYIFKQYYDSYLVYGSMVTVLTDLEGNTNGFINYYVPLDISTDYTLTEQDAIDKLEDCSQVIYAEVQIRFIPDDEPKMIWYIEYVGGDDFAVNSAIIDANSGEVLFDEAMMQD